MQDEAHLLAAGVNDRLAARLRQEPPEGLDLPDRQRVDNGQHAGGRYLEQAELAAVGVLRDKLGVEGHKRHVCQSVDQVAKPGIGHDHVEVGAGMGGIGHGLPTGKRIRKTDFE